MSGEPLIPGPLYGLRTWRVVATGDGERLAAPHRGTLWPPGGAWLEAGCEREPHEAPAPGCDCGVHGWHPRRSSARSVLAIRGEVAGVVEADGATEVHAEGFRAARGRPYALFVLPGRNAGQIERLAAAYDAEAVPVRGADELEAWCRERGLGMGESVVAGLVGPVPDAGRRRRSRALRAAALLAVAAAIAGGAVALDPGPQHDRVLNGRSGEVRVP